MNSYVLNLMRDIVAQGLDKMAGPHFLNALINLAKQQDLDEESKIVQACTELQLTDANEATPEVLEQVQALAQVVMDKALLIAEFATASGLEYPKSFGFYSILALLRAENRSLSDVASICNQLTAESIAELALFKVKVSLANALKEAHPQSVAACEVFAARTNILVATAEDEEISEIVRLTVLAANQMFSVFKDLPKNQMWFQLSWQFKYQS